jgi:hypothetical protein
MLLTLITLALLSILLSILGECAYRWVKRIKFFDSKIQYGDDDPLVLHFIRKSGITEARLDDRVVFSATSFAQNVSRSEFVAGSRNQYKVLINYNAFLGIFGVVVNGNQLSSWVFPKPLRAIVILGNLVPALLCLSMLVIGLIMKLR